MTGKLREREEGDAENGFMEMEDGDTERRGEEEEEGEETRNRFQI